MICDFHAHTFPPAIAPRALSKLSASSGILPHTDGTEAGLLKSMAEAGISQSVNMPVHTRPDLVGKLNRAMVEERDNSGDPRVIRFGGIHPLCENWQEELRFLHDHGVPGIKLHPAYQGTDLNDIRCLRIIGLASELGMIVMTHAGPDISIPGHDYASVDMILQVIREVQPQRFVAAHMGGWGQWSGVQRDLAGAPVWLDTAFTQGPVDPADPGNTDAPAHSAPVLPDDDAVRLIRSHGADRILFGTDSPWVSQRDAVQRIMSLPLTDTERSAILWENAAALLQG